MFARATSGRTASDVSAALAVRTITSVAAASQFVTVCIGNAPVGWAVHTLTIDIQGPPVPPVIRSVLILVPYLTDLTLLLPATTPPALLLNVNFRVLRFFKTNLPHRVLFSFLTRHNSVSVLIVGPCGGHGECPLAAVDFGHVHELECEAECAKALVHHNLRQLGIAGRTYPGARIPAIFRQTLVVATGLYSLTVDFFPDDTDVLDAIRVFAPFLKKLKLVEQRGGTLRRASSQRRAFKGPFVWGRALRKFPHLEEFALKTSADLVAFPGHYDLERRAILGWVFAIRMRNSQHLCTLPLRQSHPALYHIRVWYGRTRRTSSLSKWFKHGQEWERLGQPVTGDDLDDIDF